VGGNQKIGEGLEGNAPKRSLIARRLIVAIVLFSSAITLTITSIQLYLDYQRDIDSIHSSFDQIQTSFLKTLALSVWSLDGSQIQIQIDGLLKIPDMELLQVEAGNQRWEAGSKISNDNLIANFPIHYTSGGISERIGELTVVAGLDGVYLRLLQKGLRILLSNGIKTFLVAGFILFLFHFLVTRHLLNLGHFTMSFSREKSFTPLNLNRPDLKNGKEDELDLLVSTVNDMCQRMCDDFIASQIAEKELRRHHDHLEDLVRERTVELEALQEELIQKEKLATLGKLTATVSHELRNPLGTIKTSMHTIIKSLDVKNENLEKAFDRVVRNIDRCDNIIDEMLDFTGQQNLKFESVFLDEWIETFLDEQTASDGIQVRRNFNAGGVSVEIAPERFLRAVINVLENAFQAVRENDSSNGGHNLGVVTVSTGTNGEKAFISDSGAGIAENLIDKIFQPLFSTKNFGVGLGLPIVKNILDQHHGGIEVETKPGKGAIFTLILPLSPPNPDLSSAQIST